MSEFIKPHTQEGWEHLCNLQTQKIIQLYEALDGMVDQFAYITKGRRHSGGLSALEAAFEALDLSDPHPAPAHLVCDEPGCGEESTCGTPSPGGYRRTCHKHMPKTEAQSSEVHGTKEQK